MAVTIDGKLYTDREAKKIMKERENPSKKKVKSLLGSSVYWLGPRDENFPLHTGEIIGEGGGTVTVKGLNRKTKENFIMEKKIEDINFDK